MTRKQATNFNYDKLSPSEYAHKLQKFSQTMVLHRRREEYRCDCYSATTRSFNNECDNCISGYKKTDENYFRIVGYAQITEFPANDGAGKIAYKTGGAQFKIACYVFMLSRNAKFVRIDDHILLRNHGVTDEFVVYNKRPLSNGANVPVGSQLEMTSSSDKRMAGAFENYDRYI